MKIRKKREEVSKTDAQSRTARVQRTNLDFEGKKEISIQATQYLGMNGVGKDPSSVLYATVSNL
jgi:hypothetical protein